MFEDVKIYLEIQQFLGSMRTWPPWQVAEHVLVCEQIETVTTTFEIGIKNKRESFHFYQLLTVKNKCSDIEIFT